MSIEAALDSLQRTLEGFAAAAQQVALNGVREVARVAVEDLRARWPVDTGASRDGWQVQETPDGAIIRCSTDYSSYTFAKGDKERVPIYLDEVPAAIQRAANEVGIGANMVDLTKEYFGQGRTTMDVQLDDGSVIGNNRKMIQHTPANQAEAWLEQMPQAVTAARVFWRGKWRDVQLVPSDYIAAGGAGSRSIRPRRRS